MTQLDFWLAEHPVNHSALQVSEKDLKTPEETLPLPMLEFLTSLDPSGAYGKTCQVSSVQMEDGILVPSLGRWQNSGMGSHIGCLTLNTSEYPSAAVVSLLSDVLETGKLQQKFYLSGRACLGILRRAEKRGKKLPDLLQVALETTAREWELSEEMAETSEEDQKP